MPRIRTLYKFLVDIITAKSSLHGIEISDLPTFSVPYTSHYQNDSRMDRQTENRGKENRAFFAEKSTIFAPPAPNMCGKAGRKMLLFSATETATNIPAANYFEAHTPTKVS